MPAAKRDVACRLPFQFVYIIISLASIMAASLYLRTLRIIFTALYTRSCLSQHSTTRPKVPGDGGARGVRIEKKDQNNKAGEGGDRQSDAPAECSAAAGSHEDAPSHSLSSGGSRSARSNSLSRARAAPSRGRGRTFPELAQDFVFWGRGR